VTGPSSTPLDEFFIGYATSRPLFDALHRLAVTLGDTEVRVTRSQIAFRRERDFAWAWLPDRYLGGGHAPLVLSVALRRRDPSPRWKEIVEPSSGWFMHHLEVNTEADLDAEVRAWLEEARAAARGPWSASRSSTTRR
jgi:hypothetical protein